MSLKMNEEKIQEAVDLYVAYLAQPGSRDLARAQVTAYEALTEAEKIEAQRRINELP